jgi:hypothetical protein
MQFQSVGPIAPRRAYNQVVRGGAIAAALAVGLVGMAPRAAFAQVANKGITTGMTCDQFMGLVKSDDKQTLGIAILWLDGVYAGRSGLDSFPPGFAATLGQAAGGTCAIGVNSARLVVDVLSDIHKQYGQTAPAK